ncbi:MAG: hypothetical protein ACFCGT_15315 [Sandaracinaceae bacterium]
MDRSADELGLPEAPEVDGETASAPPPPPGRVVAGDRTPLDGEPPRVTIRAPRSGQRFGDAAPLRLTVRVRAWALGPAPGNHVHVIVDNEPYIAVHDVSAPLDLRALVEASLGRPLGPGRHVVRVFPSRPTHESVKADGAFAMVAFQVGRSTEGPEIDEDAPLLTYSHPTGCHPPGAPILLDFLVHGVDLEAGEARVRYTIDGGVEGDITRWVPHTIENLPLGDHRVRLRLVDREGALLPGPFNDTTRVVQVGDC